MLVWTTIRCPSSMTSQPRGRAVAGQRATKLGMIGEVHLSQPVEASFPARVDAIDPVIDAASDTFRVRLLLPNPGNAIPAGIRCSVTLPDATAGE